MSDAAWLRVIEWGLRIFQAALILLWPKLMFLTQDRALRRDSTLFGVRVPSDFGDSQIGREIFDEYRKRIWLTAILFAAIFAIGAPMALRCPGFGTSACLWACCWHAGCSMRWRSDGSGWRGAPLPNRLCGLPA